MRGKGDGGMTIHGELGITPAYAGKSLRSTVFWRMEWDHPRLCGEKSNHRAPRSPLEGSPPPMRGKGKGTEKKLS